MRNLLIAVGIALLLLQILTIIWRWIKYNNLKYEMEKLKEKQWKEFVEREERASDPKILSKEDEEKLRNSAARIREENERKWKKWREKNRKQK